MGATLVICFEVANSGAKSLIILLTSELLSKCSPSIGPISYNYKDKLTAPLVLVSYWVLFKVPNIFNFLSDYDFPFQSAFLIQTR